MTQYSPVPPERPSFGTRLYNAFLSFLRGLVRLVLLLIVIALVYVAGRYGVPWIRDQYVVPLNENTRSIANLEARQDQDALQVEGHIEALRNRLTNLEVQRDQDKQTISELQAHIDELNGMLASQEAAAAESMAQAEEQIAAIGETLEALDEALAVMDNSLGDLAVSVGDVALDVEANRAESAALAQTFADAANPINALRRELQLVKAMELITRSRLFLGQQNFGLVEQDLQAARDLLISLNAEVFDFQQETLEAVIDRLDLALENLPDDLDLVESDLEAAWQLLVQGLPSEPPEDVEGAQEEPAGEDVEEGEETTDDIATTQEAGDVTPTPEVTPTPALTPTPTAMP